MHARNRMQLILVSFLVILLGGSALADNAALQEKLKRKVTMELEDVTIAKALEQIGIKAGITIELSEEAIWELPQGTQTQLSVTLEGQLDQSLEQMLNAFFMRYAVGNDAVVIYPRPELKHIMGRPTPETLRLLRNIYTNGTLIQGDPKAVEQMSQAAVNQMAGQDVSVFPLDMARGIARVMEQMVGTSHDGAKVFLASILDEVVESVSRGSDRWIVCAPEWPNQIPQIKIISHQDYNKMMRDRFIDLSFEEEAGLTILRHLAGIADVKLDFAEDDRTWLERTISIEALNVKVDEALHQVTNALGGELRTVSSSPEGVHYIVHKKPTPSSEVRATRARTEAVARARAAAPRHTGDGNTASAASTVSSDQYVGKISIPMEGGKYFIEYMLRESDLTDELRRLRAERIRQVLKPTATEAQKTPTP